MFTHRWNLSDPYRGRRAYFEVGIRVPQTPPLGDAIPVQLELPLTTDGPLTRSNVVSVAIESAQ